MSNNEIERIAKGVEATRLDDQLCFSLYAATNAVMRVYRPLLAKLDLTYPQYLVMLVLWEVPHTTAGAVARRLGLAANAITPLLYRLEAAGLIARERDLEDRRRVHVHLTEPGAALRGAIAPIQQILSDRIGMKPGTAAALRGELHALAARLESENEG